MQLAWTLIIHMRLENTRMLMIHMHHLVSLLEDPAESLGEWMANQKATYSTILWQIARHQNKK